MGAGTVGRQRSHHPNKPNSDVNRTQVRTKSAKTQITENMCLICLQAFKFIMHPKHKSLTCTFACVCVHTPAGLGSVLRMDGYYAIRFWLCSSMLYCYKGRFCSRFAFLIALPLIFAKPCMLVRSCSQNLPERMKMDEVCAFACVWS